MRRKEFIRTTTAFAAATVIAPLASCKSDPKEAASKIEPEVFRKNWAQEILFNINQDGDLTVAIYPGNTKSQGHSLFSKNPNFNKQVVIFNEAYEVSKTYHIKFTSFQKYFTGLWFGENSMKENLYTRDYFYKYTGRKKRGNDWAELGNLFDNCIITSSRYGFDSRLLSSKCVHIIPHSINTLLISTTDLDIGGGY